MTNTPYILYFEKFGRHKDIELPLKAKSPEDIFHTIDKHYKKYLLSNSAEVSLDPVELIGDIFAGFQHVGKFKVTDKASLSKMKEQNRLDTLRSQLPKTKEYGTSGYVSPEGDYYKCHSYGHIELAEQLFEAGLTKHVIRLGYQEDMENWIHISRGTFYFSFSDKLTQKQIDFLDDYMRYHQCTEIDWAGFSYTLPQILDQNEKYG